MQFYIIYTPHTIANLHLILLSLIENTSIKIIAVGNGLGSNEMDMLSAFEQFGSDRFGYVGVSEQRVLSHPEVLMRLYKECNGDVFAFMDSDVFAFSDFVEEVNDSVVLGNNVFSGAPLWADTHVVPIKGKKAAGRFLVDQNGYCLGGTYFSIYNKAGLDAAMDRFDIDFSHREWSDLKTYEKNILTKKGLVYDRYDNAKVLNVLLDEIGHPSVYMPLTQTCHFGGLSRYMSFISRNDQRLERHKLKRKGQQKMREMDQFMAEALDQINRVGTFEERHAFLKESKGHVVKKALEECVRLRTIHIDMIKEAGLC
jgi:hypothetical protein